MKLTTNILIFSLLTVILSISLSASSAPMRLSQNTTLKIKTVSDRPIVVSTNFMIRDIKLILTDKDSVSLEILKKGFVLIPKRKKYYSTVVLIAKDGTTYSLSMSSGGKKDMVKIEDPIQDYNSKKEKFNFESGQIDKDARNIVKAMLLNKKLSGFVKSDSYQTIKAPQYKLTRVERFSGGKYVADRWELQNTTRQPLYFQEEDFYTEGVVAVALEKNRVLSNEKIFLLLILNKATLSKEVRGE